MHARDIDIVADVLAIRIDRFDVFLHNLPDEAWAAKGALGAVVEAVGMQMPISKPARMGGLLLNLVRVPWGEGGMLVIVEVA